METLKVLIVDDEPGMRRGALKTLRKYQVKLNDIDREVSFELDESGNGETTLYKLEHNDYDLVFLDYKLPDISGLEILQHIQGRDYDFLTVMMTAYASLEVAISATKNGAFDFLAKPFSPDELRAVARKAASTLLLQRHARKLEEEKRQVRFQFLSVLAHELKAPLNAIEGYLKIMDDRIGGDNIEDYDKMITRSLVRVGGMRKLIFDLLDLTRIESGQKVRDVQLVNVTEAAIQSMESVQPDAAKRSINVVLHADEKVMIHGDSSELEIIFNNLVSNAVKYNREQGTVDIFIEKQAGVVTIRVRDTGIGMSPPQVEKLFHEFVRFKNPKARDVEGSGLGLSILKRLSKLYYGDVSATSELDVGTTFTLTLKDTPPEEIQDEKDNNPGE